MKKTVVSALSLLLSLCLLAGCQTGDTESAVPSQSVEAESNFASVGEPSGETSSEITLPPDDLPIEETDYFTEHGQGVLPETAALPVICQPTKTEHLYGFPIDLPDAEGFSVFVSGDVLHLAYWTEEAMHRMYSLTTGEMLCELTLPSWNAAGVLSDGGLWCVNLAVFEVAFYGTDGTKEVLVGAQEEGSLFPVNASVTPDGRYLLALYEDNSLILTDLQNETRTEIDAQNGSYWSIDAADGMFYLRDSAYGILCVDCADKTAQKQDTDQELGALYGELWQYYRDGAILLGEADTDGKRFFAPLKAGETLCDLAFGCAVTNLYAEDAGLRFYDLRKGILLSELSADETGYGVQAMFLQSGAVLLMQHGENGTKVFWYDLPAAARQGEPIDTLLMTESELKAETDRIAHETEQKTGVDLLYSSEGNDFVLYDYVGEAEKDPYTVYEAVKTASEILAHYPEGMLRESYAETHRGLQIYLCGTIYGKTGESLSQAGGVTTDADGYILVAVNVHNNLAYDLPHELSHVFDRRISHVSFSAERDWMMLWESATPIENVYAYSYDAYYEYTRYTAWNESDADDVWFADSYARTFPTEDRARIMEHLFNPTEDGLADVLQFKNLQTKARLYCLILRECFASCDVEEPLYWETYLGTIDNSVIPQ